MICGTKANQDESSDQSSLSFFNPANANKPKYFFTKGFVGLPSIHCFILITTVTVKCQL